MFALEAIDFIWKWTQMPPKDVITDNIKNMPGPFICLQYITPFVTSISPVKSETKYWLVFILNIFSSVMMPIMPEKNSVKLHIVIIEWMALFTDDIKAFIFWNFDLVKFTVFVFAPIEQSVPTMKNEIICDVKRIMPGRILLNIGIDIPLIKKAGPEFTQKYNIRVAVFLSILFFNTSSEIKWIPAGYPHIKLKSSVGPRE